MPVLEYLCKECGKRFDELVRKCDEEVVCPVCGARAERLWSGTVYSATGKQKSGCTGNCSCCGGCH